MPNPGYGGPVAHWWQQSLLYTGPGYDWRYEGIIFGYCSLYERIKESGWLARAQRAGMDLVNAQLPDGHYPASAFEINPASGGTPHEAAADLALLHLAGILRAGSDPNWDVFAQAALRNLRLYYLGKLWDPDARSFRDHPQVVSFVPNKAATAAEAFFAWSELSGEERWGFEYGLPNLDQILAYQVREKGPLHGAIAQNSIGARVIPKYMPFYNVRCIPALVKGYQIAGQAQYLEGAAAAMDFICRFMQEDGSLPAAIYLRGQVNRYPGWVAGLGDVLRAADLLRTSGWAGDTTAMEARMLNGQDESGGIQTATGFAAQAGGTPGRLPDARDLLHVTGWADKAFRYLAGKASERRLPDGETNRYVRDCVFLGRRMTLTETAERVEIAQPGRLLYQWIKGERWARQADPAFWLH